MKIYGWVMGKYIHWDGCGTAGQNRVRPFYYADDTLTKILGLLCGVVLGQANTVGDWIGPYGKDWIFYLLNVKGSFPAELFTGSVQ
ncbi:unnamed protein product [Allacma fusca]|uniref:Uncharacterized protein n=1 Tax=Allacma fusca TaxID=39272 RepID=A0A8J2L3L3_9HEXA|nr:unnamed protein product [Allacma fusca]